MATTVRFAPSPTGLLHLGNARIAVVNRLFALAEGARYLLRIDDTDRERSRETFAAAIREELADWDNRSVQDELGVLRRWAGTGEAGDGEGDTFPAGKVPAAPPRGTRKARVTFDVPRVEGPAKCTAANGRLEIRLPVDFTTLDRRRLEEAVRRMLEGIMN